MRDYLRSLPRSARLLLLAMGVGGVFAAAAYVGPGGDANETRLAAPLLFVRPIWLAPDLTVPGLPQLLQLDDTPEDALMRDYPGVSREEAERRIARQPRIEAFGLYLDQRYPRFFGDLWIDHADGGKIKVAVTKRGITAGLARRFGLPPALVVEVPVRYTFRELDAISSRLFDRLTRILGVKGWATAIDVSMNSVVVYLAKPPGMKLKALLKAVRRQYPGGVRVTVDPAIANLGFLARRSWEGEPA